MWFLNIIGGCTHLQIATLLVFQQSLFIDIFVKASKSSQLMQAPPLSDAEILGKFPKNYLGLGSWVGVKKWRSWDPPKMQKNSRVEPLRVKPVKPKKWKKNGPSFHFWMIDETNKQLHFESC